MTNNEVKIMKKTDANPSINSEIKIPTSWHSVHLKKPQILFRDNNRRHTYIQVMRSAIVNYNASVKALQRPIELNDNTFCQLDALMDAANRITAIQQLYEYQPAGNLINRFKRAMYDWFYPKTTATVKHSLSLNTLVSTQVECQQQAIEAVIYQQHEHALLSALSFQQTPTPSQTHLQRYMRYNQVLSKHAQVDNNNKPVWASSTYCTACDETSALINWLGKSSLQQKCETWIANKNEDSNHDKQKLFAIAKYLSASIELNSQTLIRAKTVLADWGQWAKQTMVQFDKPSSKADDLCFIFMPTQATAAKNVTNAYPIMKQTLEAAKANKQQQLHHKLNKVESLAEQCLAKNQALINQCQFRF
jgi:hypothetical protein